MLWVVGLEKRVVAGDRHSGTLQGSMNDDAVRRAFARGWAAEKMRNHDRRGRIERSECLSPADVTTIVAPQHAVDRDIVQTAAEELDLLQKIFEQIGEQAPEIVPRAANRSGASGIDECLLWDHG